MATVKEVQKAFNIILGAGLDFPPRADEIPVRVEAWCELLEDVPGAALIRAAKDLALAGDRFPSIPALREQVRKVEYNHGRAGSADPAYINRPIEVPGIFRVDEGWEPYTLPARKPFRPYPPEVQAELDKIEELYSGEELPPDDVQDYIDRLIEGAKCTA